MFMGHHAVYRYMVFWPFFINREETNIVKRLYRTADCITCSNGVLRKNKQARMYYVSGTVNRNARGHLHWRMLRAPSRLCMRTPRWHHFSASNYVMSHDPQIEIVTSGP